MVTLTDLAFGYRKKRLFTELDLTPEPGRICRLLGREARGQKGRQ